MAGGKTNTQPPKINHIDECIINSITDLSGDRNSSGNIPFSSYMFWGQTYGLPKHIILFYWDIIKVSEGKVNKWQSKRTA